MRKAVKKKAQSKPVKKTAKIAKPAPKKAAKPAPKKVAKSAPKKAVKKTASTRPKRVIQKPAIESVIGRPSSKAKSSVKPKAKSKKKTAKKSVSQGSSSYSKVFPLDPKTGKPIKPKPGQLVRFGFKKGRGYKKLGTYAQKYLVSDHLSLEKKAVQSRDGFFTVFFEHTGEVVKDAEGKAKRGRYYDKFKKKVRLDVKPKQRTKVTGINKKGKQKPVLYKNGEKVRELDFGYKERNKRHAADDKLLKLIPIGKKDYSFRRIRWSEPVRLTGDTLKDALENVIFAKSLDEMREEAASYFEYVAEVSIRGAGEKEQIIVGGLIERLVDAPSEIGHKIRVELAKAGLRFTSLFTLEALATQNPEAVNKILNVQPIRKSALKLRSVFPENEFGYRMFSDDAKENPIVSVVFKMRPISG